MPSSILYLRVTCRKALATTRHSRPRSTTGGLIHMVGPTRYITLTMCRNMQVQKTKLICCLPWDRVIWLLRRRRRRCLRSNQDWSACPLAEEKRPPRRSKGLYQVVSIPPRSWPQTEGCIMLRSKVMFMLNKGHLQDLFINKGKASFNINHPKTNSPASLAHVKVINVISGGPDVCGLTYSVAKRLERDGPPLSKVPMFCGRKWRRCPLP